MNLNSIKPQVNLITEKQLDLLKANGAEVYEPASVDAYRLRVLVDAKNNPKKKEQILEKAKKEMAGLTRIEVLEDNGQTKEYIIKYKNGDIEKGLKFPTKDQQDDGEEGQESKNEGGEEESEDKDNSDQSDKDDDSDNEGSEEEEGNDEEEGSDDENSDENEEEESDENDSDEEGNDEDESGDDDEVSEEDEKAVLQFISESLENGDNEVDQTEVEEGASYPDDETKKILNSLQAKNLIEVETDDNGNMNVTGITDEGKAMLGGGNGDDEGNNNDNVDQNDDQNQDDQGNDNNQDDQQNQNGNDQNQGNQNNPQYSDDELASHAKNTPTDKLQEFIKNPNIDPKMKQIAEQEIASRNGGNGEGNGDEQNSQNNADGTGNNVDPEQQENEEFSKWIDSHFSEHDEEDLAKIVKDLIAQAPGKRKELKEKFKADFETKNGGNKVSKVDEKEFDEWLDQYLAHLPFNDLKDYANKLVSKNPEAFLSMKKKFKMYKDNNMLDS